jgi:hypothetical protein
MLAAKPWFIGTATFAASFAVALVLFPPQPPLPARPASAAVTPAPSASDRISYSKRLEHVFLEAGIDVDVRALDLKLSLFGPFSKPMVYKVAKAMHSLGDARKFGFKSVEFTSGLREGVWRFDLEESPTCDRDLCF